LADGSIIIDARLNKKGAESDLKALQAKAKSTAQQIAAVDKQLGGAQTKRNTLADSLESARQKARETADALSDVNRQIDAAEQAHLQNIKNEYPSMSDTGVQKVLNSRMQGETKLMEQQSKLLALSSKQESVLNETVSAYQDQDSAVQALQQRHDTLTDQLAQENQAVERQQDLIQHLSGDKSVQDYFDKQVNAIEAAFAKVESRINKTYGSTEETATQHAERIVAETKKALASQNQATTKQPVIASQGSDDSKDDSKADRIRAIAEEVSKLTKDLTHAALSSKVLKNALRMAGGIGQKAFAWVGSKLKAVQNRLAQASQSVAQFRNRIARLVSGALVFNVLSSGLRTLTNCMGTALLSSASLRQALGNLQGAASTAAAPLIQVLTPALTALANAAATVFAYLAKLVAFLTGKTVSSAKAAAKGMSGTSKAAKDAAKSLAGFDEIERLDKKDSSSGGSGASGITPNYDFDTLDSFLDSVLAAIEAGEWNRVGQLIAQKLNEALAAIPWPDIQDKAQTWATNIADTLNGFVARLDWRLVGSTIAQGLNTALLFVDTFMQKFQWETLGNGLGNGLEQCVAEVDWVALGRVLTDGMRAAILTLYGFVQAYTGWTELGSSIATCINSAISNIPWQEAGAGMNGVVLGLLAALIAAVEGSDWTTLGQSIVTMIGSIDWVGLFSSLSTLAVDVLAAINSILDQVDWGTVGQTFLECLQAIDWGGILSQIVTIIINTWPLLIAMLGASLLPQLGSFIVGTVLPSILGGLASLIAGIVSAIGLWPALLIAALIVLATAIIAYLVTHWDDIKQKFGETLDNLKETLDQAGENIKEVWNACWTRVKEIAANLWAKIQQGWDDFWTGVRNALDTAAANIKQGWNNAWNTLAEIVSDIWDGITSTIKTAVNGIIGFINRMISAVVTGINAVINALNGLSFDLPDIFGGGHVGFHISTLTAPQIPYLAQGAVIPANREFLAVLGDQSHGTNVEAPLDTIKQAVAEVMEDLQAGQMAGFEAVVSVLREILSAVYGIELTDEDVGRAVQRWQRKQLTATGGV
jgi:hypothetical protein